MHSLGRSEEDTGSASAERRTGEKAGKVSKVSVWTQGHPALPISICNLVLLKEDVRKVAQRKGMDRR